MYITDLRKEEFTLTEDNVPQEIALLWKGRGAVSRRAFARYQLKHSREAERDPEGGQHVRGAVAASGPREGDLI